MKPTILATIVLATLSGCISQGGNPNALDPDPEFDLACQDPCGTTIASGLDGLPFWTTVATDDGNPDHVVVMVRLFECPDRPRLNQLGRFGGTPEQPCA